MPIQRPKKKKIAHSDNLNPQKGNNNKTAPKSKKPAAKKTKPRPTRVMSRKSDKKDGLNSAD